MIRILDFVGKFDFIRPIVALLHNLISGPTHTFGIPVGCGWSGREVRSLLKQNGVDSWGRITIKRIYTLTVKRSQASWAQYVLDQAGVLTVTPRMPEYQPGVAGQATQPRITTPRQNSGVLWWLLGG